MGEWIFNYPAEFFLDESLPEQKDMVVYARQNIKTEIRRSRHSIRALKSALMHGDGTTSLSESLASKILETANYWSIIEKRSAEPFYANRLNCRLLKFGPIPGKPMGLGIAIEPSCPGWNRCPVENAELPLTWAEIDVKNPYGRSKLRSRHVVACKRRPEKNWKIRHRFLHRGQSFMKYLDSGDTIEFYFHSYVKYPNVLVESLNMVLHFDAENAQLNTSSDTRSVCVMHN